MTKLYSINDYNGTMEIFEGKTECDVHKSKTKIGKKGCFHCHMARQTSKEKVALKKENTKRRAQAKGCGEVSFISAYECPKCKICREDLRLQEFEDDEIEYNEENRKYFKTWIRYTINGACAGCDSLKKQGRVLDLPIFSRETILNSGMFLDNDLSGGKPESMTDEEAQRHIDKLVKKKPT
ncbi:hypothetical protein [Glaciecola sp. 1036]|uniref:hypothetical protein n=1 Tax=Alteromonadaceae TaxID=72275 RepID=UPI003CFEEE79